MTDGRLTELPAGPARTFRSRAVFVGGLVELVVCGAITAGAVVWILVRTGPTALPAGLAVGIAASIGALSGLSRMTARLVVGEDSITWTWWFSRHELAFVDLSGAMLAEKGSPTAGGPPYAVYPGGLIALALWLVIESIATFSTIDPVSGSCVLMVTKVHGDPVVVRAVGSWATRVRHSQVTEALEAVQAGIDSPRNRARQHPRRYVEESMRGSGDLWPPPPPPPVRDFPTAGGRTP